MLYNYQRKKLCRHLLVGGALCAAGFGMFSCSDTYDLDSEQPSNLNSIYGYMHQQGNFTNYLHLIDDLGMKDIFSKTGSKTAFVANDEAFAKFYQSNPWGVKNYGELTLTQKKLLLNGSMIDNPYSTSMLSTAEGPVRGEVCRRSSSQDLLDSVLVVASNSPEADAILPHNDRFDEIRANHDSLVLFCDASQAAPIIHFNYKFMASNKMVSSDIDFLYNQPAGTRGNDDVYVNDAKVIKPNIFCKNGFVHQVDKVIVPLDNLSEIIRKDPETQVFSSIIERFAAVDHTNTVTQRYNSNKGTSFDSVFVKRYYSERSDGSSRETDLAFNNDKNNNGFNALLKFDPGWTGYLPLSGDPRDAMMEDMAVMLVPTDSVFDYWWNYGGGKVIKDYYHEVDSVPEVTISKLVNVNMLASLVGSVPSRFTDVLDDANERLGIEEKDVKEVHLGSNGVVYKTNKVFAPKSYSSVLFPAIVDQTNFRIIENAISRMDYDKYLNSMVAHYIFLLPTNDGMLSYVDPVSYFSGDVESQLWEFHYDETKSDLNKRIYADVYKCTYDFDAKKWVKMTEKPAYTVKDQNISDRGTVLYNRLQNLLDNIIVTTGYEAGQHFYKTKGNTFVRVDGITTGSHVYGSLQSELGQVLEVQRSYNMENGTTLVLDGPIMGTRKSVASQLNDRPELSDFFEILNLCGAINKSNTRDNEKWAAGDQVFGNLFNIKKGGEIGAEDTPNNKYKATYLLNNFHYTVYAPTNDAMQQAYELGLPTPAQYAEVEELMDTDEEFAEAHPDTIGKMQEVLLDFVKYHIQDNSIYVDQGFQSGAYESGKTELIRSTETRDGLTKEGAEEFYNSHDSKSMTEYEDITTGETKYMVEYYTGKYSPGRPYKIKVDVSASGMTVTDNIGKVHNVITSDPSLYNIQAAEYWYTKVAPGNNNGSVMTENDSPYSVYLNNSSSVVVHAIDGPMIYADGAHKDAQGEIVETQFEYKRKELTK